MLRYDLRYAFRHLRRRPGFAAISILTLAFGIGASTSIFSLLNTLLLRPLPVSEPGQLVQIGPADRNVVSLPLFEEIASRQQALSGLSAWQGDGLATVDFNGTLTRADFYAVDGNFYNVLGASPAVGRLLAPSDVDLRGAAPANVVVLGYDFWQRTFHGSPSAIGKSINIEGTPFIVLGVTRAGFKGLGLATEPDVTIPLSSYPLLSGRTFDTMRTPAVSWLRVIGRLRRGVALEQAHAQITSIWPAALRETVPAEYSEQQRSDYLSARVAVISAATGIDSFLRARFAHPLYVLMGLAGLVLLIACINLSNLMLAENTTRSHEMALGVSRWRLARQILTESMLLSCMGALAGMAIAYWSSVALGKFMMSTYAVPPALSLAPDGRVLGFTAGLALLTGMVIGTVSSAQHALRKNPATALQESSRTMTSGSGRFGRFLMCAEIAFHGLAELRGAFRPQSG